MEVKSLYRTYRPKTFDQVIGQKHVTQTLINQIKSERVAHAYLFCGTRGTGKTSVAKIFASAVNKGAGGELDIFEMDAASNNSVQDVRDIIEKVKYPPVAGAYKVYIIDEVHMFSPAAFNAFLKTLEEPPSHAIFILCTTEPHKLIPTVQSRCLRFDFRAVGEADIQKHLAAVLKKEKITASPDAVKMLAESGAGSVRDALSFTETVISYAGEKEITADDVTQVLGTVSETALKALLGHIINRDLKKITQTCAEIFDKGINVALLVKNFLNVIKTEFLQSPEKYGRVFARFSELETNIKTSADARAHFENTCLLSCVCEGSNGNT